MNKKGPMQSDQQIANQNKQQLMNHALFTWWRQQQESIESGSGFLDNVITAVTRA